MNSRGFFIQTNNMFVIIIRTLIIFLFLVVGMRLMGKRQLGELQPFEFVITLAIAELACTPMQDISIPILYGIVPLLVVFMAHFFITLIGTNSIKFRKIINGKPVIVINEDGIDYVSLKRLNMNVNDLLESIRGQQYFSIEQIKYAIIETNGKLSVLENSEAEEPTCIPVTLIIEGRYMNTNMDFANTSENLIEDFLQRKNVKRQDVLLLTKENDKIFVQPKQGKYFTERLT